MTKKHFEKAARIARDTNEFDRPAVVHAFVELFVDDNPRFDVGRFRVACEPEIERIQHTADTCPGRPYVREDA